MLSGRNENWYCRKAIAFSSMVALVLSQTSVLAGAVLGKSESGIKTLETYAQLPSFSPANPVLPLPPFGNPEQPLPPLGYPEQPSNITPPDQFSRYRLGVGDAIAVSVPRFPDLSFQSNVDLEGNIVVPLVGTLQVSGLTLERVQAKIQAGLNRFVIDPQVIVSLAALRPAQVTITGEVLRPGYYPLQPGSQLSAALLAAGGTTTTADLRTIVVRRRSLTDNSFVEQQIDLFTPLQNGTSLPNLRLQDGDAVIVSKLEVGNTSDYDRSLVSRSSVAQQQINVRVLSYAGRGIGNLTLPNGSTFVDALAAIAPNPDNANLGRIALIRFDPEQGKAVTQELNGKRALRGDVSQNVPLQNNDVIVVGRNFISRITYALSNFTQPFRDILGFLLFFDSLRESATNLFEPSSDDNDD
jgi:polysaccharide export outer membrane protein